MERPRSHTDAVIPEISFTEIDEEEEMIQKRSTTFYGCYHCDLCLYCCQKCCLINHCERYPSDPDFHRDPMEERIKEYREPLYSTYKSCCYRRVCGCISQVYEDEENFHICFGFLSCFVFAPFIGGLLCSL